MVVSPRQRSRYSFLSLGDSYTIGESVSATDRWSVQLAGILRKDGLDVADPDIIARTGWTTAELQEAIKASDNPKTYGLVSLMIGVNNQYRAGLRNAIGQSFGNSSRRLPNSPPEKPATFLCCLLPIGVRSLFAAYRDKASIAQRN